MKWYQVSKGVVLVGVYSLTCSLGYAGAMGPSDTSSPPGKIYASIFGGAGRSSNFDITQMGTSFIVEGQGGPLAVNGVGSTSTGKRGLVGGNLGIRLFNPISGLAPAVELEGYSLQKNTLTGHELNYNPRLLEQDFSVSYPLNTGVFLVNMIANLDLANQPWFHPYVGGGIGAALLSISNATSIQIAPPEPDVNHFNSDTSSKDAVFAAQLKAGVSVDLSKHISIFGEYRRLYLSSSNFTFGSTVHQDHPPTSSWLVQLGAQNYNLGSAGIRYSI